MVVASDSMYQNAILIPTPAGDKLESFFGVDGWKPMFCFPALSFVKVVYPASVPLLHEVTVNFSFYDIEGSVRKISLKDMGFPVLTLSSYFGRSISKVVPPVENRVVQVCLNPSNF